MGSDIIAQTGLIDRETGLPVPQRMYDIGDGTYVPGTVTFNVPNYVVTQRSQLENNAQAGRAFVAGTGAIAVTALALNMRVLLTNPAQSGKIMEIYAVGITNPVAGVFYKKLSNPTSNVPTTSGGMVTNQLPGSSNVSVATLKVDKNAAAMSGGVEWPDRYVPTGYTVFTQTVIMLNPGNSIGLNVPLAGVTTASVEFYYWEMAQ